MLEPRAESARDQTENAFTEILRRLYCAVPALTAVVLVDVEGECIDCIAASDRYEAKVTAAHMHMLMVQFRNTHVRANSGESYAFEMVTERGEVWVRRLGDDYVLVAIVAHGFDHTDLRDAMTRAGREFRAEVGIVSPSWEGQEALLVRLRTSTSLGWKYAPEGFSVGGERFTISDVLGRWEDPPLSGGPPLICFRVRTQQGRELTLAHDERTEVWLMRD